MKFKMLKNQEIFQDTFLEFSENNELNFNDKNIVILYGPNGTGKTSLCKILDQSPNSKYQVEIDDSTFTQNEQKLFHLIEDQNGRNIISGSTEDFILGDNIKREYELKNEMEEKFNKLFSSKYAEGLKKTFLITTKTSRHLNYISDSNIKKWVSDIANTKSKGKSIIRNDFISIMETKKIREMSSYEEDKMKYILDDLASKYAIIDKILEIRELEINQEVQFNMIEESDDAISLLKKYKEKCNCIICETPINTDQLLEKKSTFKKQIFENLSTTSKRIIEEVLNKLPLVDPFNLRIILKNALITGNKSEIDNFIEESSNYFLTLDIQIENFLIEELIGIELISPFKEYMNIKRESPQFENEDILFIEKFVNESINKPIELKRDEDGNLRLLLGNSEFLNHDRKHLNLSNGEQNFLSLAFEFMKAKKSEQNYVILDDPISSFDSIYKNKIAYAIVKILCDKKLMVLTHNTDLIKLLEHQAQNCYELYFLNNTLNEVNGFIPINNSEKKILLYIHEFIELLRSDIKPLIINERNFLISVIPFMRGYAMVTGNKESKNNLTKLMHGYQSEEIEISKIYNELFNCSVIDAKISITAQDIINSNIDDISIIDSISYPLLSKTLIHTFCYLYLRMKVEKVLVDKFMINTKKFDMLSNIVLRAYRGNTLEDLNMRVFFLSKKTLLNEFNHFEMDMNIFQPAIDITNTTLQKEKIDILGILETIN